jgi:hypothetical protein
MAPNHSQIQRLAAKKRSNLGATWKAAIQSLWACSRTHRFKYYRLKLLVLSRADPETLSRFAEVCKTEANNIHSWSIGREVEIHREYSSRELLKEIAERFMKFPASQLRTLLLDPGLGPLAMRLITANKTIC